MSMVHFCLLSSLKDSSDNYLLSSFFQFVICRLLLINKISEQRGTSNFSFKTAVYFDMFIAPLKKKLKSLNFTVFVPNIKSRNSKAIPINTTLIKLISQKPASPSHARDFSPSVLFSITIEGL